MKINQTTIFSFKSPRHSNTQILYIKTNIKIYYVYIDLKFERFSSAPSNTNSLTLTQLHIQTTSKVKFDRVSVDFEWNVNSWNRSPVKY